MSANSDPDLKYRLLWLAIGYALVVLVIVLSLISAPEVELSFPLEDKFFHALAYFTLMAWFSQIYHKSNKRILLAVMFVMLGVILEYLQSFEPSRFAEFGDMVANTAGVVLAYLINLTAVRFTLVKIENLVS